MAQKRFLPPLIVEDASVTIAASGTVSTAVDLSGATLCGMYIPAGFTGTAITFQASADGTNFFSVRDGAGAALSKTVAASQYIPLNPSDFAGIRHLRLVSGSTESAQRMITLAARPV